MLLREIVSGQREHNRGTAEVNWLPGSGQDLRICRHCSDQRHPVVAIMLSRLRTVSASHRVANRQLLLSRNLTCCLRLLLFITSTLRISPANILCRILTALLMTVKTFTEYLCGKLLKCDALCSHLSHMAL